MNLSDIAIINRKRMYELKRIFNMFVGISFDFKVVSNWSIIGPLEVLSTLANIAMAVAMCYGAFSLHSWLRQVIASRRADVAGDVLEELEYFHLRLEQLVSWQYMLDWNEWGKTFNEIFRAYFLIAKLKAQRLKNKNINNLLKGMEKIGMDLPGNQRLSTQVDLQGQLFWKKEAYKAGEKFKSDWDQFTKDWMALRETLFKEALYDMPLK